MKQDPSPKNAQDRKLRLCVMCTAAISVQILYEGRLEYLAEHGFDITAVCAPSGDDEAIRARGVRLQTFPLTRAITPLTDLRTLLQLVRWLKAEQFDLIEVATPKAALLGALAGRLAGRGRVVHFLLGLPYEGQKPLLGALLRMTTMLPCRLAHRTIVVSPSMVERVAADRLTRTGRARLLGAGSANGVDLQRFSPPAKLTSTSVRAYLRIPEEAVVVGFVGRLTRDKGVNDLARAFEIVHGDHPETVLLVVGDYEARDRPTPETARFLSTHPAVRHVGFQTDVVRFLSATDLFVLPTYREGMGNVLLEAAAVGLPTITTTATGARDATVHGTTGLQVPPGDVDRLADAMRRLVADADLRRQMGMAGREWVCRNFDRNTVWQRQAAEYAQIARERPA